MLAYASFWCIRGTNYERFVQVAINLHVERVKTRDKEKENNMNTKEMVTAMVVVGMFVAMIGTASAGIDVGLYKSSVNGYEFNLGDTIEYEMTVTNNDPNYGINVTVTDTLPNGTLVVLDPTLVLGVGPAISPTYTLSYVVELADVQPDGKVHNRLTVTGENTRGEDIDLSIVPKNPINTTVTFDFGLDGTGCMEVKFTGESTGLVDWHRWDFNNDGTPDTAEIPGAPNAGNAPTHPYTSCGNKQVRLYGESVTGTPAEKIKTIYVACEPDLKSVKATPPGCFDVGDTLTFSIGPGFTHDTPIASYQWVLSSNTGQLTGTSDTATATSLTIPDGVTWVTAKLTVVDELDCEDDASVMVGICVGEVPILTPAGLLALIGMLGIVGAGRIITNGKRRS